MLRRAALLACLVAPLAARAQTAVLTFDNVTTFGKADCVAAGNADDPAISFSWTVVPSGTPATDWTYVVKALSSSGVCTSDSNTANQVNDATIHWATGSTGTYPGATGDTLHLSELVAKAGGSCAGTTDITVKVCVQLLNGTTVTASISRDLTVQLAAPVKPTGVTVGPGDSALKVSWAAVTTTPAATSYRVVASTITCSPIPATLTVACLGAEAARGTTSGTSLRLGGLTNDVTYGVQVFAISEGGNESPASDPPVAGKPSLVRDFWDEYTNATGQEQGGCGGGPAGLASLLALAGLVRLLGRRS